MPPAGWGMDHLIDKTKTYQPCGEQMIKYYINYISKKMKIFSLPIFLYGVFIALRVSDIQPPMEGELGDFITALNFIFGASSAYLVFIITTCEGFSKNNWLSLWWWLMCALLLLLALDELFMIHETIGKNLGINDTLVLLSYGLLLGLLLLFRLKEIIKKETLIFLFAFAAFSLISQASDYFYGEGLIFVMGRDVSYEQFAESFGALSLTAAVVTIAVRQLDDRA